MNHTIPSDCPICGSKSNLAIDKEIFLDKWSFKTYICPKCHHHFRFPFPPSSLLGDYYSNKASTRYSSTINNKIADLQYSYICSVLTEHYGINLSELSVVEIGSGHGWLSRKFCKNAKLVRAFEPDSLTVQQAHLLGHTHVVSGFYDPPSDPLLSQSITSPTLYLISHVLEHLIDPASFLESLKTHSPCIVFIEVPIAKYESFSYLHSYIDSNSDCEHLHSFSKDSLLFLLNSLEWNVSSYQQTGNPHFLKVRNLKIKSMLLRKKTVTLRKKIHLHLSVLSIDSFLSIAFLTSSLLVFSILYLLTLVIAKLLFYAYNSRLTRSDYPSQRIFCSNL